MSIGNAHSYGDTYPNPYCYSDGNSNPYGDTNTNSDSYRDAYSNGDCYANTNSDSTPTDTYINSYCYTNGNSYRNADGYSYTRTNYSLSTITDDRPYQGFQHTVQFHGTSQRH